MRAFVLVADTSKGCPLGMHPDGFDAFGKPVCQR